ncbi:hypothetical protein QBC38DRAFT_477676 [Podospora fimiseda]|uniref:Stress-response A/B barrel domain-containing protein n=1 Tax=Podospora fimiseda TaxID=252190 RepID=A0AAN7BQB8_9PEZI|nr:hypothetical protein QBC38DRAFT_477676 [Podospora fimiseda]
MFRRKVMEDISWNDPFLKKGKDLYQATLSQISHNKTITMGSRGPQIHRTTMFKIPDEQNQEKLVDLYRKLAKDQKRNGKPYILYSTAGKSNPDQRSKGYTVISHMRFSNLDDMNYYDNECEAHAVLKKEGGNLGVAEPPLVVYFEGEPFN